MRGVVNRQFQYSSTVYPKKNRADSGCFHYFAYI